MNETTMKFYLIILILIVNLCLAYLGNIYHLIYLAGVCLMLAMWKIIKDILR